MAQIGVELPGNFDSAGEWLADAQAMESAGAHALLVAPGPLDRQALLAAVAAVTWRAVLIAPDASPTVELLARGRLHRDLDGWRRLPEPQGRAHWNDLLAAADADGVEGVVVALSPRLLDLLRNPDVVEDRSDLQLAQG